MGECIQGLVLLGNQWLLFVELGGFVNNAPFYVPECVPVGKRPRRIFVCVLDFFFFFFHAVVFSDQGQRAITLLSCATSKRLSFWVVCLFFFFVAVVASRRGAC